MVKVLILSGYGINCEKESAHAFELVGATSEIVHVNDLISNKVNLTNYDILMFPGGFSYGDDTGSGNALANKIKNNLWDKLITFIQDKKLILGICNGFQVMVNLGLFALNEKEYGERNVALIPNNQERYECRWVKLQTLETNCVFTKNIKVIKMPIAHGEGKFYCNKNILNLLKEKNQIVFKYMNNSTFANGEYPFNPNGSMEDIAGICDFSGRIMGMMPHPERAIYKINSPDFYHKKENGFFKNNLQIFQNAVNYFKEENKMDYKEIIKLNLNNTLNYAYVPELGEEIKGKVRHVHLGKKQIGEKNFMIASDRVSAFDHVLDRQIPFKGMVLNPINDWSMNQTVDIVKNANIKSPDKNVLIQKYCKNIMVECVVRGYVWGSMAKAYEKGDRNFCGNILKDGLKRYQKLNEPIFTPTTKSEHDEPMTFEEVENKIGKELALKVKEISLKLYKRGEELAQKSGLVFIDTKYEFGLDENNELCLIDEANTPDSSRYCTIEEYEKFKEISSLGNDVNEVLKQNPNLKIKELSKQFIRDVLTEKGFSYDSSGEIPKLADEDIIECSYRYIKLYEQLTGEVFKFPEGNVRNNLIHNLKESQYISGSTVVIMAGSDSDQEHIDKIVLELKNYGIAYQTKICSAHKQPAESEEFIKKFNNSLEPIVFVTIAGGTDALSGVVSFHSIHPVISCPPDSKEYSSCINNPPGSSNSLILNIKNVVRHIAQMLSLVNDKAKNYLLQKNIEKIEKLQNAGTQSSYMME